MLKHLRRHDKVCKIICDFYSSCVFIYKNIGKGIFSYISTNISLYFLCKNWLIRHNSATVVDKHFFFKIVLLSNRLQSFSKINQAVITAAVPLWVEPFICLKILLHG